MTNDTASADPADPVDSASQPPDDLVGLTVTVTNGVAELVIDNPPINLIDRNLYRSLASAVAWVATAESARVVVLRSANPDFFMAHFDVGLILQSPTDTPAERSDTLNGFHEIAELLRTMPKPTICAIAGRVGGGGGELAASCDMRFGVEADNTHPGTRLCQMEVPLGILPGGSGTQRLPRLLGRGPAMEIILGGDDIGSATLERWGWLNRALPAAELDPFVDRLAERIAGFPADAVARAKASALVTEADPHPGLVEEAYLFQETLRTEAAPKRMQAFLDRGGQTVDGELRVGQLGAELGE